VSATLFGTAQLSLYFPSFPKQGPSFCKTSAHQTKKAANYHSCIAHVWRGSMKMPFLPFSI